MLYLPCAPEPRHTDIINENSSKKGMCENKVKNKKNIERKGGTFLTKFLFEQIRLTTSPFIIVQNIGQSR